MSPLFNNKRLDDLDEAVNQLGFVLKAIEELSIEKGAMTRAEIQSKILDLADRGWNPAPPAPKKPGNRRAIRTNRTKSE